MLNHPTSSPMMTRIFGFSPDGAGAGCTAGLGLAGAAGFFCAPAGGFCCASAGEITDADVTPEAARTEVPMRSMSRRLRPSPCSPALVGLSCEVSLLMLRSSLTDDTSELHMAC